MLLHVHRDTARTIRDGEPGWPPRLSQLLSSEAFEFVQCCFTSTEDVRTVRDGEPRTSTSTLTQLLNSDTPREFKLNVAYVHRDRRYYWVRGPRASTSTLTQLLSSDTPRMLKFNVALRPQRIRDGGLRMSTTTLTQIPSSDPRREFKLNVALCPQTVRDG